MKTKINSMSRLCMQAFLIIPALLIQVSNVTAQISENFGTGTAASFSAYTGYNNSGSLIFSGTGDIRTSSASSGYTPTCSASASGGSNAFLAPGQAFIISNFGTSGCGAAPINFSFGVFKSTTTENGSHFAVDYSTDGGSTWTSLSSISLSTGTGTAKWYERSVTGLPAACGLQVRFRNTATSGGADFRIDDICMSCGSVMVTTCTANITASDTNVFVSGGIIMLTANSGDSYQWSDGETTQSIYVTQSGTYNVTVEHNCCFATSAKFYVHVYNQVNPEPPISVTVDHDTVYAGDSVTFTARLIAADLFFSKYEEWASFDQAIEVYNGTGHPVNLASYTIHLYSNGNCTPTYTISLPNKVIADGGVYTIANPGHSEIGGCFNPDTTSYSLYFNGNDAITLYNDSVDRPADIIGSICNNPGSAWVDSSFYSTKNRLLTRQPWVYEGIIVNPDLPGSGGFPTLTSEWFADSIPSACSFGSYAMDSVFMMTSDSAPVPMTFARKTTVKTTTTTTTTTYYIFGVPIWTTTTTTVTTRQGGRHGEPQNNTAETIQSIAYPNPFNQATSVNLNLSKSDLILIEITDMLGNTVAVLNNSVLSAGEHSFTLDGTGLADGVYICKITTGDDVQTMRIVKSSQ